MAERSDQPPESLVQSMERQRRDERISPMVRPSERKGGYWGPDNPKAPTHLQVPSIRPHRRTRPMSEPDPLRAILPEVVEALEGLVEEDGAHMQRYQQAVRRGADLLARLREIHPTTGGTDAEAPDAR
jgi:hypothetical protein